MSIALITPNRSIKGIRTALIKNMGEDKVQVWPNISEPDKVKLAVTWDHPEDIWTQFSNLEAILSLGAGADHLLNDSTIPASIPLGRVVTPTLKNQMAEFILMHVLWIQRKMERYREQQNKHEWNPTSPYSRQKLTIGIMGLGELGTAAADVLIQHNFDVHGWSRSPKDITEVTTYHGPSGLSDMVQKSRIIVCLLPLTNKTEGILNDTVFEQFDNPRWLIHVGRGEHLVEKDLISALENDKLAGAYIDVFRQEPLPKKHPFWSQSNIHITPHVASLTPPDEAAQQIEVDYKRTLNKQELTHPVDRKLGY